MVAALMRSILSVRMVTSPIVGLSITRKSARLLREMGQGQRNRRRLVFNQTCAYG